MFKYHPDPNKPIIYSGLTTKLFQIEFLAFSNTFQTSMLETVEEYNSSESTSGIILETNNTHMEFHDMIGLVPVPLCDSVNNTMSKDHELHPM